MIIYESLMFEYIKSVDMGLLEYGTFTCDMVRICSFLNTVINDKSIQVNQLIS